MHMSSSIRSVSYAGSEEQPLAHTSSVALPLVSFFNSRSKSGAPFRCTSYAMKQETIGVIQRKFGYDVVRAKAAKVYDC